MPICEPNQPPAFHRNPRICRPSCALKVSYLLVRITAGMSTLSATEYLLFTRANEAAFIQRRHSLNHVLPT